MKVYVALIILWLSNLLATAQNNTNPPKTSGWLQTAMADHYDFDPALFQTPTLSFGPMARWWWPGNYVERNELKREINLFADHGFAGVEVQPLNLAIPTSSTAVREQVTSWDTPTYYENLQTVMEEARRRGLMVDMTNGSGWPPSAPILQAEDGFMSLEFSDTTVTGGQALSFTLPLLAASKTGQKSNPDFRPSWWRKSYRMRAVAMGRFI